MDAMKSQLETNAQDQSCAEGTETAQPLKGSLEAGRAGHLRRGRCHKFKGPHKGPWLGSPSKDSPQDQEE